MVVTKEELIDCLGTIAQSVCCNNQDVAEICEEGGEIIFSLLQEKTEKEEFNTGPLSVLMMSVKNNTQVLINCCNNRKLIGRVRAFERQCNMVLENIREMRIEVILLFVYVLCILMLLLLNLLGSIKDVLLLGGYMQGCYAKEWMSWCALLKILVDLQE